MSRSLYIKYLSISNRSAVLRGSLVCHGIEVYLLMLLSLFCHFSLLYSYFIHDFLSYLLLQSLLTILFGQLARASFQIPSS